MEYLTIPPIITYKTLSQKESLSPSSYRVLSVANKNCRKIRDLIAEKPQKGEEVGSSSYVSKSDFYFIRTKALQASYFLPVLSDVECAVPILPTSFRDMQLKTGDILIAKDANIGETAYIHADLPHFMISGGLVRLKFQEDIKHYVFAMTKSNFLKRQISLMASRGATISHARTLWLDAQVPFPNKGNKDDVIQFVTLLTELRLEKRWKLEQSIPRLWA